MPIFDENGQEYDWVALADAGKSATYRFQGLNSHDREVMVSDAIMRFRSSEATVDNPEGYLRTILTNMFIDYKRAEKVREERIGRLNTLPDQSMSWESQHYFVDTRVHTKPRDVALDVTENEFIAHVFELIPDNHRLLMISHFEGATNSDIAKQFGYASAASVAQTISRIKGTLRKKLTEEGLLNQEF